jgi:hypothetical protein
VHRTRWGITCRTFGPKDLEIKTLLMDEQDHGLPCPAMT